MKEIVFVHHEMDEVISPEFVAELHKMEADRLFKAWLEDYKKRMEIKKN